MWAIIISRSYFFRNLHKISSKQTESGPPETPITILIPRLNNSRRKIFSWIFLTRFIIYVIASVAKQSRFSCAARDCFVATLLAMTRKDLQIIFDDFCNFFNRLFQFIFLIYNSIVVNMFVIHDFLCISHSFFQIFLRCARIPFQNSLSQNFN